MSEEIKDRLARVQQQIASAARRAGRKPEAITLVAVSKTFDAATVQRAIDAGVRTLGENRVQEAAEKSAQVQAQVTVGDLRWHLIGHLQSNKARLAVKTFDCLHTIDSRELAERVDRIAREEAKRLDVLVQVDLAHEATKSGADEAEVPEILEVLDRASQLRVIGLMVIPPFFEDPEMVRPYFKRLREIRDRLNRERGAARQLTELSMGMSHDFEVAIEEGATMVRVGSAIFGERKRLI